MKIATSRKSKPYSVQKQTIHYIEFLNQTKVALNDNHIYVLPFQIPLSIIMSGIHHRIIIINAYILIYI